MTAIESLRRRHDDLAAQFDRVADPGGDRGEALGFLTQQLAAHISIEQALIVPALKHRGVADRRLKTEYRQMSRLLGLIERRKTNSPDQPALLTELRDVFERHVRHFESDITVKLRDRLGTDELEEIGAKMDSAESTILSHPHAHLLSLGPLSRLTTRLAATTGRRKGHAPPPTGLWRRRN